MRPLISDHAATLAIRTFMLVAWSGSLWAVGSRRCRSCHAVARLGGGLPLGRMGFAFYGLSFAATFVPSLMPVTWLLAAASGVHLALLAVLRRFRAVCPVCCIIATAAFAALGSALAHGGLLACPALGMTAAAALLTQALLARQQVVAARQRAQLAQRLMAQAMRDAAPLPAGHARLCVLYKPECGPCDTVKASVLPALAAEFKDLLEIEQQLAPAGVPTPTLLILGKTSTPFLGLPPTHFIAMAIRNAMGIAPPTNQPA